MINIYFKTTKVKEFLNLLKAKGYTKAGPYALSKIFPDKNLTSAFTEYCDRDSYVLTLNEVLEDARVQEKWEGRLPAGAMHTVLADLGAIPGITEDTELVASFTVDDPDSYWEIFNDGPWKFVTLYDNLITFTRIKAFPECEAQICYRRPRLEGSRPYFDVFIRRVMGFSIEKLVGSCRMVVRELMEVKN